MHKKKLRFFYIAMTTLLGLGGLVAAPPVSAEELIWEEDIQEYDPWDEDEQVYDIWEEDIQEDQAWEEDGPIYHRDRAF